MVMNGKDSLRHQAGDSSPGAYCNQEQAALCGLDLCPEPVLVFQATEVLQAALEAAATVQAAQQTAGVGGGAAGDTSLPAAAASSIRDRVDALMTSLKVEDLRSLTMHARDLLHRGLVFAVHTTAEQSRQASLSLEDDRLYLHCLRDQPLPFGAVTLQVGLPLLSLPLSLPS
ncbi:hypothetical protein GWK47_044989 [Chionoecetes opilio]|uniref:Uncharacterized protein n=1 Tax=Chionoecetes opilio TaxID=41210 RepID=A0A8J5CUU7_CHIOP|nr:hypothetical protein GWK47_044989 [Chionoecetes opilio]